MAIITLTTDFGLNDFHVASLKGAIYSHLPSAVIVDISHQIIPFDLKETAYILRNSYKDFPKDTVHIIGVDALPSSFVKPIAAKLDGQYFICNDNGVLSLIAQKAQHLEIVDITSKDHHNIQFLTKELFVPVATQLAQGAKLSEVGKKTTTYKELVCLNPIEKEEDNSLTGIIIHIDNYGNTITNITKNQFYNFGRNREFAIYVRNIQFTEVYEKYTDIMKDNTDEYYYHGKALALFNSLGFLQISMYKSNLKTVGGASSLMGLDLGSQILIAFK